MTKRQRAIYESWERSENYTLWDVYSRCSHEKWNAYEHCCRRFDELDGFRFRIISANTWQFSVGFEYTNPDDGTVKFVRITARGEQQWDAC